MRHNFKISGGDVHKILTYEFESVGAFREFLIGAMFNDHSGAGSGHTVKAGRPKSVRLPEGQTYSTFNKLRAMFKEALLEEPEAFVNDKGVQAKDTDYDQSGADFSRDQLILDNNLKVIFDEDLGPLVSEV